MLMKYLSNLLNICIRLNVSNIYDLWEVAVRLALHRTGSML